MRVARSWMVLSLLLVGSLALSGRGTAQEQTKEASAQPTANKVPAAEPAAASKTQPQRSPRVGDVQKVFEVKHAKPVELARLLDVFPATITFASGRTRAVAVSAPPAVMAAIEETLKRLDVPESSSGDQPATNIELTGYIVEALAQPVEGARVPPELEGVVAQLKRNFNYVSYRVVDTLIARAREGSSLEAKAVAESLQRSGGPQAFYTLRVRRAGVTAGAAGSVVHLDHLNFGASIPVPTSGPAPGSSAPAVPVSYQYSNVGVEADLDIREGQRVVVGKSGMGVAGNAIVLVLSAKVVD